MQVEAGAKAGLGSLVRKRVMVQEGAEARSNVN